MTINQAVFIKNTNNYVFLIDFGCLNLLDEKFDPKGLFLKLINLKNESI